MADPCTAWAVASIIFIELYILMDHIIKSSEPLCGRARPDVKGPKSGPYQYTVHLADEELKTSAEQSASVTEPFQIVPNSVYSSALALVRQIAIMYQSWAVASNRSYQAQYLQRNLVAEKPVRNVWWAHRPA